MTITFRGGRLPNDPAKPRLRLSQFLNVSVVTPPKAANWDAKVSAFGMLGNDSWGDCHWAATYHGLQTWTANAATEIVPLDADVLKAYAEATGFNAHAGAPGNNPTDQGTVMQDGFDYWRKTGIPVAGTRHKILAFAQVDHTSTAELEAAAALFGEVFFGISFPGSAMQQFDAGEPWDVVPGATIEGGHAICSARYDSSSAAPWTVVTWGQEQSVTTRFLAKYLDEAWVVVAPEWLAASGSAPSGLDLPGLAAAFTQITGEPAPWGTDVPPNPPEPPSPHPDALVAAARALAGDQGVVAWSLASHSGQTKRVAALVRAVIKAAA